MKTAGKFESIETIWVPVLQSEDNVNAWPNRFNMVVAASEDGRTKRWNGFIYIHTIVMPRRTLLEHA